MPYLLMNNADLSLKQLLEAPCRQTVTRMRDHTVVLAVQDTTSLNYTTRWMIEVYHRTLKSGCRIEERQHHTARALENCLAIDMGIAARILHLTWIGRTCPDIPCTVYFENNQWKALYCFLNKTPKSPKHVPSIREFIGWVARLGGHLGRKGDGEPGTKSRWLGLPRMDDISEMYAVFSKFAEGP
jgi:hypothetical protein